MGTGILCAAMVLGAVKPAISSSPTPRADQDPELLAALLFLVFHFHFRDFELLAVLNLRKSVDF